MPPARLPHPALSKPPGTRTPAEIDEIVKANYGLVISVVNRYRPLAKHPAVDIEDLEQGGLIGLAVVAQRFDPAAGWKFSTYATSYINGYVLTEHKRSIGSWERNGVLAGRAEPMYSLDATVQSTLDAEGATLADLVLDTGPLPGDQLVHDETIARLTELVAAIDDPVAVDAIWAMVTNTPIQDVADRHGVSREWARVLRNEALAVIADGFGVVLDENRLPVTRARRRK